MTAQEKTNSGVIYLLPNMAIKMLTLVTLVYLWRVVMSSGASVGMSMAQMLSYTYASALLSDMLVVTSPATGWLSEGIIMKLYGRPLSVLGQLAAETSGGWVPSLLMFSVPMAVVSPLFGVILAPASLLFVPSLLLCVSLGFAVDIFFICLSIKLRNINWLVGRIRVAISTLLSGTIIPVKLLPFGLENFFRLQPLASLGGAPLSIFAGIGDPAQIILLQALWNLILWPLALLAFRLSQEGMVSYGG